MTILHAADLHLGSPMLGLERYEGLPDGLADALANATRQAFGRLIDAALQERPAVVLIAGDAFDTGAPDFQHQLHFAAGLGRLSAAGVPVVMLTGNHDAALRHTRAMRLPPTVRMLSAERPESYEVPGTNLVVHGQGFSRRDVKENLAARYPLAVPGAVNVGLLHTALAGAEGHEPYAPCTLADLRALHYDYWALGHIHQRHCPDDDPRVVFPGNLQGRHARETGPKGCVFARFAPAAPPALEFRALDVARWEHIRATADPDDPPEAALARLADACRGALAARAGQPTMLRATLTGATPAHHDLLAHRAEWTTWLRMELQSELAWLEKLRIKTAPPPQPHSGPLGELWNLLAESAAEPDTRAALARELGPLVDKLRPHAEGVGEEFRPDDPAWQDDVFAEALAILRHELQAEAA